MPLYLVATPIGNLGDITYRAVEALKAADLVACEDTRHSRKLFQHLGIKPKTTSYHHHNRHAKIPLLLGLLEQNQAVALVSDAGTPGISDPGQELVAACIAAGVPVVPIPGACALVAAVTASGFPTESFVFEGFLPAKLAERRSRLAALKHDPRTLVFYEAPHRLLGTLVDMQGLWGDRQACVARELTKLHETFQRGTLTELALYFEGAPPKGEIVLVVAGAEGGGGEEGDEAAVMVQLRALLAEGRSPSEAAKLVAGALGVPKRRVYQMALALVAADE